MAKNHANGIKVVKGYKAFNSDWTCKGFKYEVGKTYKIDGEIKICERGFHFCTELADCFNYYPFEDTTKVAEVEATGLIISKSDDDNCPDSKKCTNEITIVREIPRDEILRLCNIGKGNIGLRNIGDNNTGNCNEGCQNTGRRNIGDRNVGKDNTGNENTGDYNIGNGNTGNWNEGFRNTGLNNRGDFNTGRGNMGNENTGDWNSTDFSTGCFCTEEKKIELFDKPSNMTLSEWRHTDAYHILENMPTALILWLNVTDIEKKMHPEYKQIGNESLYLIENKTATQKWFDNLSDDKKKIIMSIPNFDAEKFRICTGIDVRKTKINTNTTE